MMSIKAVVYIKKTAMDNSQQVLPVFTSNDDAYFDSFFVTEAQHMLVASLKQFVEQRAADFVYISGIEGLGKSHLLQAVCHLADGLEQSSLYLPLGQVKDFDPQEVLYGHQHSRILCVDDVDVVAGNAKWEVALFDLYNQRMSFKLPLYMSANKPSGMLDITLADLKSRLSAMLSFQMTDLSDAEKSALFHFRALQRGMDLNESCLMFILQRSSRNINDLMQLLQHLDQCSLAQGRKITVPFIKSVMGW